ncbi:hypothetical protein B0H19DRAFT_1191081 [Mycena capillaripes]|nr:hypothetical protein B0H19DRAFT_1191081 [Mycena capillaripes]
MLQRFPVNSCYRSRASSTHFETPRTPHIPQMRPLTRNAKKKLRSSQRKYKSCGSCSILCTTLASTILVDVSRLADTGEQWSAGSNLCRQIHLRFHS